jgi:TPR repeat protein
MRRALIVSLALAWLGALEACGGTPAEALRPKDPSVGGALGESTAACRKVESYGEPLVVDWRPEQRGDLEEAMHDGVVLVSYSCSSIKILKACKLEGEYGYLGMTRREQVVRLQDADELQANLPLNGLKIAGEIGGDMQRGAVLDVALITVGKRRTTWRTPTKDDLKGDCAEATHFVRGATVGAFAVQTGTRAQVRTAVQVFGAGGSGSSSSVKNVSDKEGDPNDCSNASPDAKAAPAQCGAAIRLELVSIAQGTGPRDAAKPDGGAERATLEVAEEPCPQGLVQIEGKCARPAEDRPHLCSPDDQADCQKQCDKGHAASCGVLGAIFHDRTREYAKAMTALKKGCDGGDARSCTNLGQMVARGVGTKADPAAAMALFENGCNQGDAMGCALLGDGYRNGAGVSRDDARAAALYRKACDGGNASSCGLLGLMMRSGQGVARDDATGKKLLSRACDGNDARACAAVGEDAEDNNPIFASIVYQRGCFSPDLKESAKACVGLGRVLQTGPAVDTRRAKSAYEMACNKMNPLGCASLKLAFGDPRPVVPDVGEQNALMSTCNAGNARACASLGILQVASGNAALGKMTLQRACSMNSRWACEMKGKAP